MPKFCEIMNWPVEFIATADNSVNAYAEAIIAAIHDGKLDYVVPMPEALLFDGLVDALEQQVLEIESWVSVRQWLLSKGTK